MGRISVAHLLLPPDIYSSIYDYDFEINMTVGDFLTSIKMQDSVLCLLDQVIDDASPIRLYENAEHLITRPRKIFCQNSSTSEKVLMEFSFSLEATTLIEVTGLNGFLFVDFVKKLVINPEKKMRTADLLNFGQQNRLIVISKRVEIPIFVQGYAYKVKINLCNSDLYDSLTMLNQDSVAGKIEVACEKYFPGLNLNLDHFPEDLFDLISFEIDTNDEKLMDPPRIISFVDYSTNAARTKTVTFPRNAINLKTATRLSDVFFFENVNGRMLNPEEPRSLDQMICFTESNPLIVIQNTITITIVNNAKPSFFRLELSIDDFNQTNGDFREEGFRSKLRKIFLNDSLDTILIPERLPSSIFELKDFCIDDSMNFKISFHQPVLDAFNEYGSAAALIVRNDLNSLEYYIDEFTKSKDTEHFFFICGPSWIGKTQLIYAFDHLSKYPLNSRANIGLPRIHSVLHFVATVNPSQRINLFSKDISSALYEAIDKDLQMIDTILISEAQKETLSGSFCSLFNKFNLNVEDLDEIKNSRESLEKYFKENFRQDRRLSLIFIESFSELYAWKSLGLIGKLIEIRVSGKSIFEINSVVHGGKELKDFNSFIENLTDGLPILVCIDEFNDGNNSRWLMMRNLLRKSKVVPILLGTNARVANLVGPLSMNYPESRLDYETWCKLIIKLPAFHKNTIASLGNIVGLSEEIKTWIYKSPHRPGITLEFLKHLKNSNTLEDFQQAAKNTLQDLVGKKSQLLKSSSLLGFFYMLFPKFRAWDHEHNHPVNLVDEHLAHLIPSSTCHYEDLGIIIETFKARDNDLRVRINDTQHNFNITACSTYLDLHTDELTQFIIMNGWDRCSPNPVQTANSVIAKAAVQDSEIETNNMTEPEYDFDLRRLGEMKLIESMAIGAGNKDIADIWDNDRDRDTKRGMEIKRHLLHLIKVNTELNIFSLSFRAAVEFICDSSAGLIGTKLGKEPEPGEQLEWIVHGSFVKASASMGVAGGSLEQFLPLFVSELQLLKRGPLRWHTKSLELLGDIANQIVPFTLAVDYRLSKEFRDIPGTYTGSLILTANNQRLDGLFVPDWAIGHAKELSEIKAFVPKKSGGSNVEQSEEIISLHINQDALKKLYISLEMKLLAQNMDFGLLDGVLERAVVNGRYFYPRYAPENHLHLVVCSSLANLTHGSLKDLKDRYSCAIRLMKMTFDENTGSMGLVDMFNCSDAAKPENPVKDQQVGENILESTARLAEKIHEDLHTKFRAVDNVADTAPKGLEKAPQSSPCTQETPKKKFRADDFPNKSTVIIIGIQNLFGESLSSPRNVMIRKKVPAQDSVPSKRKLSEKAGTSKAPKL